MAHELDSQGEWQRLVERYRAMSDGELLQLAAGIGDLTETAGEVLRGEMRNRRLTSSMPVVDSIPDSLHAARLDSPDDVELTTFHDALRAGSACKYLEAAGIEFEVKDVSSAESAYGPVALRLVVKAADAEQARTVLRRAMGLFPLPTAEGTDELVDDGSMATAGTFGLREEAEEIAQMLEEAGIWHRIVANPEGTVEDQDCFTLEVREVDLMRAGDVVEASMELPEE
jgi:hypothetical protein